MPHEVKVESDFFQNIYEEAGYRNCNKLKSVPRLNYLKKIKRKNTHQKIVLVAFGMHDYKSICEAIGTYLRNRSFNYILKFHPKTNFKQFINNSINLEPHIQIGDRHISHYLSFVTNVFVTYSSVGWEAHCLGIKTSLILMPNKICESPLLDIYKETKDPNIELII